MRPEKGLSSEVKRLTGLYIQSCETILSRFQTAVDQFNREFQHGSIRTNRNSTKTRLRGATFHIPTGGPIRVVFFGPKQTGIRLRGGEVIGGGWIGVARGRSANLVLREESSDDLHGRWTICEFKLMALADPRKLIARLGLTKQTVQPFGFNSSVDFYDQMRWATRGLHVLTCDFVDDIEGHFAALVEMACKM